MVIGGFWHGASWNFIFWGVCHGLILAFEKFINLKSKRTVKSPSVVLGFLQTFVTFHIVCALWIFFKSESFSTAGEMIYQITHSIKLLDFPSFILQYRNSIGLILAGLAIHFSPNSWNDSAIEFISKIHWIGKTIAFTMVLALLFYFNSSEQILPIYLQF